MSQRDVLPIPDGLYEGPVYEDAKDPRARYARSRRSVLRPARPTCW